MDDDIKLLDENGIRLDGRKPDELRPINIKAGVLQNADGSAYIEWGKNKVLAAVYGPREVHPRHLMDSSRAIVQCRYNMAAFSVGERKRPGYDRRSIEISKVISEAMEHVIFTEKFPRTTIDVFIEVLQANAGTRCAGLTVASVALADAGIPMLDLVPSCAAGKIDEGFDIVQKARGRAEETDEGFCQPEIPRTEGLLWERSHDRRSRDRAIACYREALDLAIQQTGHAFALKAAINLADALADLGETNEARNVIVPVFNWFEEGFESPDYCDAKQLITELQV